jgi:hypothetical protein
MPTAVHEFTDAQDTEVRALPNGDVAVGVEGLCALDQVRPFQDCTIGLDTE